MSNIPSAGTSGEPESTGSVGGAPSVPVPIQSPAGVAAFGGISGPSPIISVTVLPRTESAGVGGGTHTANPSAQETRTESELTTPNYSEDKGVTKEESPSLPSGDVRERTRRGVNPKGVRFELYEGDDETLKKEFDERTLAERDEYIANCQNLHTEIQAEKETKESELKSLLKKEKYRLLGPVHKKLKVYEEEYNQQIQKYEERLKLTAPEIREMTRKEREAERRKRGGEEEELEELNKKINETRILGESSKGKGPEVPRSTEEPRKSRVSLGLTVPVMHSRNPYTPFKIEPVATQFPVGGYLGTALAASTPRERIEQSPSPPPPPTRRPVPLHVPGFTKGPARVPAEEPTAAAQGTVETGAVAAGRKMSGPEKSAYKKGKKKMKEARRAQKVVERAAERERREKIEKLKLSGYKMKLPTQYDGTPNMEIFEQWHYKLEEHRAAGKCFLCSEVGHNKRDCPKRNTARPTGLSSSSINYARIEALGAKRPELSISAVDFNTEGLEIASESEDDSDWEDEETICYPSIELNAARTKKSKGNWEIERNSAVPKDLERKTSAALVVEMFVNGKSCRVLLDSGSLGDFISTTIVDQLKLKAEVLAKPMGLSMAVTGSRSQVKHSVVVNIKYQGIDNTYRLDVANLD
ncbi:Retrotransposon gag protein [Ceratobasidium sp. AG-Ba]|nr:Retrotransposon gag protein [Ceratobasidium sp. AG-Ba]